MAYLSAVLGIPNLLAHWRFGEPAGTSGAGSVLDASGNGRHTAPDAANPPVFGAPGLLATEPGATSILYNGDDTPDQRLLLPVLPVSYANGVSLSVWLQANGTNDTSLSRCVVMLGGWTPGETVAQMSYPQWPDARLQATALQPDGSNHSTAARDYLFDERPVHAVATFDASGSASLYVNGGLVSVADPPPSGTWANAGSTSPGGLIGEYLNPSQKSFWGRIQDFSIYGRPLTAAEVARLYIAGSGVDPQPKAHWIGDSHSAAGVALAAKMGWLSYTNAGVGGTGYVEPSDPYGQTRLTNLIANNPGIVCIEGGGNDTSAGQVAFDAGVTDFYTRLRAALPKATLYIIGSHGMSPGYLATLRAAAGEYAGTFLDWGPFLTGTGKVGTPAGDGNRDVYLSADGVHCVQAGYDYIGARLAHAIHPPPTGLPVLG